ncbi:LysR family transcriptional regulator [Amylibacter marinus]|uniref:LysR family transcriptional regulator n=1 Tax=Amylibacter marinus TaxID=1475483 RepID=A0ABQ5VS99_9RHOB|nr:LysR family transcriptional regulator [Amylibacter marinus]GLQ34246.1 LysR family transcriptional regulator [Amylibacter marinus]
MDRIDLMSTYVAVANAGSFTGAAHRLGMTPQLVSKYVRALEDQLDAQLFIRSTRSVRLTQTGAAYLEKCTQLLEDFDELAAAVRNDHRAPQGHLTIAAPTTYGEIFLADALADFAQTYPKVQIDLRLSDRYASLLDDGIDVAIRIGQLEDSSFVASKLSQTRLTYCASPHYIATQGAPQKPKDLLDHSCIIDSNFRPGASWPFSGQQGALRIDVDGRLRANSASVARRFALKDCGILLSPEYVIADDLKTGRLVPVLERYWPETLGIFAVYLENRHLSAKVRVFVDFMRSRLR